MEELLIGSISVTNPITGEKIPMNAITSGGVGDVKYSSVDTINEEVINNYKVVIDKDIILHDLNLTRADITCVNGAKINTRNRPFANITNGEKISFTNLTTSYIVSNDLVELGDYIFIRSENVIYHHPEGSGLLKYGEIIQITKVDEGRLYFDHNIELPSINVEVFKFNNPCVNIDVEFEDTYTSENPTEAERNIITINRCVGADVKVRINRFTGSLIATKNCVNSTFESRVVYGESGDDLHLSYSLCDSGSTACEFKFDVGSIRHPFTCTAGYGASRGNVIKGISKGISTCLIDDHEFAEMNIYKDIVTANTGSNQHFEFPYYMSIYTRSSEVVRDCELEALSHIYVNRFKCTKARIINCHFYSDKLSSSNILNATNADVQFVGCVFDVAVNVFENPCKFINCIFNRNVNDTVNSKFINCVDSEGNIIVNN